MSSMDRAKSCFENLAIFGRPPAFDEKLHVGRPNIGDRRRLLERIEDLLDRRWLTNSGPYVEEFEQQVSEMVGTRHCIATCNGTLALEIAIMAAGLTGEVIVPSFTFIATAHALQWRGITPIFCDIDPGTHNIDPHRIEQLVTLRTTGVIGVHLWGRPCEAEALAEITRRHDLKLIFDAAHAFGCSDYDNVTHLGTNGKMSEVAAAMGLTSLEDLEDFIAVNHRNYKQYERELADIPGIRLSSYDESEKRNYQYVVLDIDEEAAHLGRDALQKVLWAENVLARRYFYPGCHRMEPYRSCFPYAGERLPNTERLSRRVLSLPTGTGITADQIAEICRIIRLAAAHGPEVREKLKR